MAKTKYRQNNFMAGTIFGLFLGIFLSSWCRNTFIPCVKSFTRSKCCMAVNVDIEFDHDKQIIDNANTKWALSLPDSKKITLKSSGVIIEEAEEKGFLFVGIMTAKKYVDSRVVSAYRTWVKTINGKVVFFSSQGSNSSFNIPVISLLGVDDSYPPQKKSFMMLKYMYEHYIEKYEWFVRADDDVFIKGDKLEKFLRSVNSSVPHFIGQAGVGTKEEYGQLSLGDSDNYCMGGTGIVFSRETLRRIYPHLQTCLKNLYTTHEDVEVGRCVHLYANAHCTWAFEMQHLFFQNFKDYRGSFETALKDKEVLKALTLHPVKTPAHQYRVYNYIKSTHVMELRQKIIYLQREIDDMNQVLNEQSPSTKKKYYSVHPSLLNYVPMFDEDLPIWDYFVRSVSSHAKVNPRKSIDSSLKIAIDETIEQTISSFNKNARQKGRTIDFKEILYGYTRTTSPYGADYVLDVLLTYRKHKGKRMTVPVRRHSYIRQPFTEIEIIESPFTSVKISSETHHSPNIFRHFIGNHNILDQKLTETIHFILPLAGKITEFKRFMKNFEDICLSPRNPSVLHLVLFTENSPKEDVDEIIKVVGQYQKKYGGRTIEVIEAKGPFARAGALDLGAKQCSASDLLFFVDVDILFNMDSLSRIRLNTIRGAQIYFPVVFSQYDPSIVCSDKPMNQCNIDINDKSARMGYWRQFGYGIAAMYHSDLEAVGGFDITIQGWGKEDVDLFGKTVASNLTIFRSVDLGMVHAFHHINCDVKLDPAQFQMCVGSKASSLGSQLQLAELVQKKGLS
ncbi:hypothetical protein CHS0354_029300 [Potamilus streckersoni]|uniref:Hexosyltransferase n=1 Tax=Potamilus streckersoni TaxID=2493646 RepID=A0AAE0T0P0_9BIVA|nr:hypothetical protein CHS0354_029300 [Potamilus streckersoni]